MITALYHLLYTPTYLNFNFSSPMGNTQSLPKRNFYITRVTNMDLPLVPFVHTIVGFNNTPVRDTDPIKLKEVLRTQDLCLEVLDVILNKRFQVVIPQGGTSDGKMGINVTKLAALPVPLRAQITAVRETADTPLRAGDRILGIDNVYVENEEELFFEIKSNREVRLVVLRGDEVELMDCKGPEIGCEVGTGLLYSVPEREYVMRGYTGKIVKGGVTSSNVASQDAVGEEGVNQDEAINTLGVENLTGVETSSNDLLRNELAALSLSESGGVAPSANTGAIPPHTNTHSGSGVPSANNEGINGGSVAPHTNTYSGSTVPSVNTHSESGANGTDAMDSSEPTRQPQAPVRPSGSTSGLNVLNKDKTTSYAYISPRSQDHAPAPINQTNASRIYEEAGVPPEDVYFAGERTGTRDPVMIINSSAVCKGDLVMKDGETRIKDEAYEERKKNECKNGGVSIFDDEDDQLPFDYRNGENIN